MKKLFYLLLALPFVFAACSETPDEPAKPEMEKVLAITSQSTMEFDADGGTGVITYTVTEQEVSRTSLVPEPVVEATCDAEWVTDLTVGETITFVVLANELEEARETKVVVVFGAQRFEVAVAQKAKVVEAPEYAMDVKLAAAARIPSSELGFENNVFVLAFIDDAENIELGVVLEGAQEETILQAGDYTSVDETLVAEYSELVVWDPALVIEGFAAGAATVAFDGELYTFDIELTDENDNLYHFTYEGVVMDMEPTEDDGPKEYDFEPVAVKAYFESHWQLGNFELQFYINEVLYHSLDMQDIFNANVDYLSEGLYTVTNGAITWYSNFVHNVETGEGAYVEDAEMEVSYNEDGTTNLKGFILSEYGVRVNIDWTGVVEGFNLGGSSVEPSGNTFEYLGRYWELDDNSETSGGDYVYKVVADGVEYKLGLYYEYANEEGAIKQGVYNYCYNMFDSMYSSFNGFVIESDSYFYGSTLTATADGVTLHLTDADGVLIGDYYFAGVPTF